MKKLAILLCLLVAGCASVPRDAYRLNKEVGEGLQAIHQSNIGFTQYYFRQRSEALAQAEADAISALFLQLQASLPDMPALTPQALAQIEAEVQSIRQLASAKRAQLHSAEQALISRLNEDYAVLAAANKELSAMLKSLYDIEDSKQRTLTALNLQDLEQTLDTHLAEGLTPVAETNALLEALDDLLTPNDP